VTEDGLQQAVGHFRQAIELDPGYAVAHAALADAYTLWSNFTIIPSREAYLNAKAAALEALTLDDSLADAHTTLAMASLFYDWDWPVAERSFRRALALDPNDARVHQRYGLGLMWLGRFDEARAEIERARALNPVDLEIHGNLSLVLYFARRYGAAIVEARQTLVMDPHSYQGHRTIARALLELGDHEQAIAAFQRAIASDGIRSLQAELGHAYAVAGRITEADGILETLARSAGRPAASPFDRAVIHTGLGDTSQALDWLDKSYAERERWMVTLKVAPVFDPLRADPRFADLLGRVGLWQDEADRRPNPVSPVSRPD
jgi:serine/threonine-protein kinase